MLAPLIKLIRSIIKITVNSTQSKKTAESEAEFSLTVRDDPLKIAPHYDGMLEAAAMAAWCGSAGEVEFVLTCIGGRLNLITSIAKQSKFSFPEYIDVNPVRIQFITSDLGKLTLGSLSGGLGNIKWNFIALSEGNAQILLKSRDSSVEIRVDVDFTGVVHTKRYTVALLPLKLFKTDQADMYSDPKHDVTFEPQSHEPPFLPKGTNIVNQTVNISGEINGAEPLSAWLAKSGEIGVALICERSNAKMMVEIPHPQTFIFPDYIKLNPVKIGSLAANGFEIALGGSSEIIRKRKRVILSFGNADHKILSLHSDVALELCIDVHFVGISYARKYTILLEPTRDFTALKSHLEIDPENDFDWPNTFHAVQRQSFIHSSTFVDGHWRRTRSGGTVWVQPHFRR